MKQGCAIAIGCTAYSPQPQQRLDGLLSSAEGGLILERDAFPCHDPGHVEVFGIHRTLQLVPFDRRGDEAGRRDRVGSDERPTAGVTRRIDQNASASPCATWISAEQRRLP